MSLDDAIARTQYVMRGCEYWRESFVSLADGVLAMRLTASQPGRLSFSANWDSPFHVFAQVQTIATNAVALCETAEECLGVPGAVRACAILAADAEFSALTSNCTTTWTTRNGVSGRLVTGKGAYASKSIFLPAAGLGYGSGLVFFGSYGRYWSSTPYSDGSNDAWYLSFFSGGFSGSLYGRFGGQSVRPVRGFAK